MECTALLYTRSISLKLVKTMSYLNTCIHINSSKTHKKVMENGAPFSIDRALTTKDVKETTDMQDGHLAATSTLIQTRTSSGESGSKLSSMHKNSGKKKQKLSEPTNSHQANAESRKQQHEKSRNAQGHSPVPSPWFPAQGPDPGCRLAKQPGTQQCLGQG